MSPKLIICVFFLNFCYTNGAVLLWSKHKLEISPLRGFTDLNLDELVEQLGYPETVIYRSTSRELLPGLRELLDGYYTAYNPNGEIDTENATVISTETDLKAIRVRQQLQSSQDNVLSVLSIPNLRPKRELGSLSSTAEPEMERSPGGSVVYRGQSKKDNYFGILYSSQPLLLRTSNSSVFLGRTSSDLVTVDTTARDSYTRLNVNIPIEEGNKITLRFIFAWATGYWTLTSVKISDTQKLYDFNLSIEQDVSARSRFSYHCSGTTVFSDRNNTELVVYDLQVQIDSKNGKFSDAYDCVTFTTPPIWSGLFVTGILGIGLVLALIAISDIKTMDKFDNYKTKQLSITVTE